MLERFSSMTSLASEHAELVAAVSGQRDRQAFAKLFDYYSPRINAYLQRLGTDRSAAEEMTQEVMTVLWHKADLFDPTKSSLGTWLYRIARNRRIDLARRNRVDYVDPGEYILDIPDEDAPSADQMLDAQTREDVLRQSLAALPEEQRDLVRLAFFDGLSHSDIAARTGIPLGTVKSRIRLAFSRLRRELEAGGVEDAV
jgi:RNA polymerase sigma-70 factor (ECF subfamily)